MVKQVFKEYMDYATIHGVGRAKQSPFVVLRVLWIIALCASLGTIIWQVCELYKKFESYPISTSIEVTTAKRLHFPDVTLCNTNPLVYETLPVESPLADVISSTSDRYNIDLNIFNVTDLEKYNFTEFDSIADNVTLQSDILWHGKEQFKMRMNMLRDDQLKEMSQPIDQFILLCTFAGVNCSTKSFEQVRTYDFGQCFRFVPDAGVLDNEGKIGATGQHYALELVINVDQADSVPFVTSSAGVAIDIQHPEMLRGFFNLDDSVFVPTGFDASIALTEVRRQLVPGKSGTRCQVDITQSLHDCKQLCHEVYIEVTCKCHLRYFQLDITNSSGKQLNETFDEFGMPPCYTDVHYACIQNTTAMFVKHSPGVCTECMPPCSEAYFEKDVAMFTWPSDNFLPILRRILQKRYSKWDGTQTAKEFVSGNLALVRVFLKSLTYQTMTEEYSYTAVNFISDIGGQLGLWAGFSVLSGLEIMEVFLILCATAKSKKKDTKVSTEVD